MTPALIHNRYADIAKEVRRLSGRRPGASEDSLKLALKREQETARDLRAENLDLRQQLQAMASVNESLRQELRILQATRDVKVVSLVPPKANQAAELFGEGCPSTVHESTACCNAPAHGEDGWRALRRRPERPAH